MDDVVLITPPAIEPVTLTQVKSHAKIYTTADDSYICSIVIPAARQAIEDELHQVLITQTWLLKRDGFPGFDPRYESFGYPTILVPKPPFQAIDSFTYVDVAGVTQTLYQCNPDGTTPTIDGVEQYYGYQLDPGSETQPGRLIPPWARPWPPSRRIPMSVQVQFVAGYGPSSDSPPVWISGGIPMPIISAILLEASHLYYNRDAIVATKGVELARGVSALLSPYVNRIA
jgi:uncharacterized phiE125 gp8 family phage protein